MTQQTLNPRYLYGVLRLTTIDRAAMPVKPYVSFEDVAKHETEEAAIREAIEDYDTNFPSVRPDVLSIIKIDTHKGFVEAVKCVFELEDICDEIRREK